MLGSALSTTCTNPIPAKVITDADRPPQVDARCTWPFVRPEFVAQVEFWAADGETNAKCLEGANRAVRPKIVASSFG